MDDKQDQYFVEVRLLTIAGERPNEREENQGMRFWDQDESMSMHISPSARANVFTTVFVRSGGFLPSQKTSIHGDEDEL